MPIYNALLRTEAFQQQALEQMHIGFVYINFTADEYTISPNMIELLGIKEACVLPELNGFVSKAIHPEDWGIALSFISPKQIFRNNRCEVKMLHANGSYNWYEIIRITKVNHKSAITELVLTFTNIDRLKKLQNRCTRLVVNMGIVEDVMNIGFWEFDIHTGEQFWSAPVYDIFELAYNQELSYGQMLDCVDAGDKEKVLNAFEDIIGSKTTNSIDLQLTTLKNKRFWVRVIARPQLNQQGAVVSIHGVLQKIHEQKLMAIASEKATAQVRMQREKLKNISHLVTNQLQAHVSHLTMIANMTGLEQNSTVQTEWVNQVKKVTAQLSATVNNITSHLSLEFKNTEGKKQLFFKDVFNNAAKKLNVNVTDAHKLVDVDFSNCQSINYEPLYVENVMLSLMQNAMEYKQPGKKPVLSVKTFLKDNQHCMQISDNGFGIDLAASSNNAITPLFFLSKTKKRSEMLQASGSTDCMMPEADADSTCEESNSNIYMLKF